MQLFSSVYECVQVCSLDRQLTRYHLDIMYNVNGGDGGGVAQQPNSETVVV